MIRRLIPEAILGALTLLVAGAAAIGVEGGGTSMPPNTSLSQPQGGYQSFVIEPTGAPMKLAGLPDKYFFSGVVVDQGDGLSGAHLALTGQPVAADDTIDSTQCVMAPVDPDALKVGDVTRGSCNDPLLQGESVAPVFGVSGHGNQTTLSIAAADSSTGAFSVGPVIMTFASTSDTRAEYTFGGGSLWIYDAVTSFGPVAVQVSERTGKVVDTVVIPELFRPLLAANDDGLWIGNSVEGSSSPDVLYHVASGSTRVTGFVTSLPSGERPRFTRDVEWLTASGHNVWAGVGPAGGQQTIWRFEGPNAKAVFHVPDRDYKPFGVVVGSVSEGLWTEVTPPRVPLVDQDNAGFEDVLYINPTTGSERLVAQVPSSTPYFAGPTANEMAIFNGRLYILVPPTEPTDNAGIQVLVRVGR
jgi:hypothetical protein